VIKLIRNFILKVSLITADH